MTAKHPMKLYKLLPYALQTSKRIKCSKVRTFYIIVGRMQKRSLSGNGPETLITAADYQMPSELKQLP